MPPRSWRAGPEEGPKAVFDEKVVFCTVLDNLTEYIDWFKTRFSFYSEENHMSYFLECFISPFSPNEVDIIQTQ